MADLTGQTPAATYKGLLQVNDYTDGVDATAKYIQDGEGTDSALAISTGNVGIGTASPNAKLEIVDERIIGDIAKIEINPSSAGNPAGLHITNTNANFDEEAAYLKITDQAGSHKFRVQKNGNVGIGTTSPVRTLHIVDSTSDGSGGIKVQNYKPVIELLDANVNATATTLTQNQTKFTIANNSVDSLTIDSNGNVGIGTDSPSAMLHINEGGTYTNTDSNNRVIIERDGNAYIAFVSPDEDDQGLHFYNTADSGIVGRISYRHRAAGDSLLFKVGGATQDQMVIDSNGNVGIGTDSLGTNAAGVIGIKNGTAPTSSPADMVQLYAEDVTASSELRVRDEAGNVTTLSPHAKDAPDSLYDNGKGVDEMHRVANHYLGVITFTNVDRRNALMQKQLNGEELPEDRTFTVTETFAEYNARTGADLQVEDWDANQQAMFDAQEEMVVARQAEIDAWDNEEEEAPEPLQSYVKKPKPDWLS